MKLSLKMFLVILAVLVVVPVFQPVPPANANPMHTRLVPDLKSKMGYCNQPWTIVACTKVQAVPGGYEYFYEFHTELKVPVRGEFKFSRQEWAMVYRDKFPGIPLSNWRETSSGYVIFAFQIDPGSLVVISGKSPFPYQETLRELGLVDENSPLTTKMMGGATFYSPKF